MGADSTLFFYGIRFETHESESEALQKRSDSRIVSAREHHLAHWWGNFAQDDGGEKSFLFVGTLIGNVGYEGKFEIDLADESLVELMEATKTKLKLAGFAKLPCLFVQFEPDY